MAAADFPRVPMFMRHTYAVVREGSFGPELIVEAPNGAVTFRRQIPASVVQRGTWAAMYLETIGLRLVDGEEWPATGERAPIEPIEPIVREPWAHRFDGWKE